MTEKRFENPFEAAPSGHAAILSEGPLSRLQMGLFSAGVWVFAFLVRLVYLVQIKDTPMFSLLPGDARSYDIWAQEISRGHWLGDQVFYQAPLYPYFLGVLYAVFGRDFLLVRMVQMVLGATSCLFIAWAASLFFSRRIGVFAGVLLALYPTAIYFDCLIQKSVLDLFFVSLLLLVLGLIHQLPRGRWWAAGGAVLGFLTLSRENALVLVPAVVAWCWVRFRDRSIADRWRSIGWLMAGLAIVLFPVALRNRVVGGEFHLTTAQAGPNLYIGNNKDANGTYTPLRYGRGDPDFEREDATQLAESALGRKLGPSEVSKYWIGQVVAYARGHPGDWLRLMARKWYLVWNKIELADSEDQYTYADASSLLGWLNRLFHLGVLAPLGLFGMVVVWEQRSRIWVLYVTLFSYAASVALFYVFARYRFPIVAWLVMFAAAGLVEGFALLRAGRFGVPMVAAGCAFVAAIYANQTPFLVNDFRGVSEYNIAVNLKIQQHKIDEAIAHYRLALRYYPELAVAHADLGALLGSQGKTDEAISELTTAVQLKPDVVEARYNLAAALANKGMLDEAIAQYLEALRLQPDLADVRNDLGSVLLERGQVEQAVVHLREAIRLKPDLAYAHYNLARALAGLGNLDEAVVQGEEAIRLKPEFAAAHYNLGNFLVAKGHLTQAAIHYQEALRIKPDYADAHNNWGLALAGQGQSQEAIMHFLEALRLQPANAEAHVNLAIALVDEGRYPEAVAHYGEAVRQKPEDVVALNGLARLLATCQDERVRSGNEAVALAIRACELTGYADPTKLDTLAAACADAGRFADAIQAAQKAAEMATAAGNLDLAQAIRDRIELYKLGKPWREPPRAPGGQ